MSVTLAQDGWFGEGDDFFYIDGEEVPSLQGTGSEDYFNDAWGFRPRTGPWFGQPRWQGDRAGDSGVCYRWHVLDPVGFTKSLRVTIEHKGNYDDDLAGFYVERPDFVSSVAFWYQTGEPKRFAQLPPWHERRVPWRHSTWSAPSGRRKRPARRRWRCRRRGSSAPGRCWPGRTRRSDARLTLPFTVDEDGNYVLRSDGAAGPAVRRYDILIDDNRIGDGRFPRVGRERSWICRWALARCRKDRTS